MSKDNRASIIELENEFNRAMALLTDNPLPSDVIKDWLSGIEDGTIAVYYILGTDGNKDTDAADCLVRIAAIALEGAARLRRTK